MKQYPYPKRARLSSDEMPSQDAEWHDTVKPSFSNNGIFTYSTPGSAPHPSGDLVLAMPGFVGEHYDVRFTKFVPGSDIDAGALNWQKENTTYDLSSAFPLAQAPAVAFFSICNHAAASENAETLIWHLCSILFDELEHAVIGEYTNGVPHDRLDEFGDLLRLDTLKEFWHRLVESHAQDGLKRARSPEEKAVYYLTQNDITNACETLIAAKDFKLAAMVAQLPGSQRSRNMMREQITAWKNRNDWSEMSEPIRAIYSILAGEVCVVQGKIDTPENRVSEFSFSKRFALSWQQGFALRLFYGGHPSIRAVINDYTSDLDGGHETKKPVTTWTDGKESNDVLFEILTLAQDQSSRVFDPLTVSGSALNSRLAWQLTTLLNAHDICSTPQERLDKLTYDFATELENAGDLVTSVWALLHIGDTTDTGARQKAVSAVLSRKGGAISEPKADDGGTFQELAQRLHIPVPLIWTAKALYAKAGLHNSALELEWLINAGNVDTAHEILCTTLGPQAVIEQDYDILSHSLQLFPRRLPDGWQRGGQVYLDFVRLINGRARQRLNVDDEAAMKRLRRGLAEMEEEAAKFSQVERVAIYEMGKVLDDVVREHHGNGKDIRTSGIKDVTGPSLGSEMLARYQQAMGIGA
jgi:nuclear pore complex protein Nup98-Nup96